MRITQDFLNHLVPIELSFIQASITKSLNQVQILFIFGYLSISIHTTSTIELFRISFFLTSTIR